MDARQRTLHRADDLGERDPLGGPGELEASLRPALALHDPRMLQLAQDVQKELQRDTLRGGDLLGLDRPVLGGRAELCDGPNRIIGLGGDAHRPILPHRQHGAREFGDGSRQDPSTRSASDTLRSTDSMVDSIASHTSRSDRAAPTYWESSGRPFWTVARPPSTAITTSRSGIWSGDLASSKPPSAPRWLRTTPPRRRSVMMLRRNRCGILWAWEIASALTRPCPALAASSAAARRA